MYRGKFSLHHQGGSAKVQISWPKLKQFYVNAFLLTVNDRSTKKSYYQVFDFTQRYSNVESPFPNIHQNLEVTIYGLKRFADMVNGGWFFVLETFGQTTIETDSTKTEITLVLVTSEQDEFPKLREEETFEVDNVFYPPSWYSLTKLSSSNPRRDVAVIYLEGLFNPGVPMYKKFVFIHHGGDIFQIPFPLKAVSKYKFRVKRGVITRNGGYLISASAHATFQTYMTQFELEELYKKAVDHIMQKGNKIAILHHFYRTKPQRYFDVIRVNGGGVMRKYIKNLGGDPASSLNRNIKGLFFSAHLDVHTLAPPTYSPYGDQRLHIAVPLMMWRGSNLYFADFYCHVNRHRVTLVLTHQGTKSDIFCRKRLLLLPIQSNPFLTLTYPGTYAEVTMEVKVEIFYTEDVNIRYLIHHFPPSSVFFTRVKMNRGKDLRRAGLITSIGFSKKEGCRVCNLNKTQNL